MTKEATNQDIEFVSDPTGYHVNVPKHHTGRVYFVITDGVVDKTCFDNFERADKRLRYFKYHCGQLTKTHEVAKCSLQTWKQISGYFKVRNRYQFQKRDEDKVKKIPVGFQKRDEDKVEKILGLPDRPLPPPKPYKKLYLVECEQPGKNDYRFIKVGVSTSPVHRVSGLQIGCPFDLRLIHETESNSLVCSLEKWFHRKMEEMCERGEWFKLELCQLDGLKKFLDDDRLFGRGVYSIQEKWDKIWEEHNPFSNRDWMVLNA